jgi:hypothetical protein
MRTTKTYQRVYTKGESRTGDESNSMQHPWHRFEDTRSTCAGQHKAGDGHKDDQGTHTVQEYGHPTTVAWVAISVRELIHDTCHEHDDSTHKTSAAHQPQGTHTNTHVSTKKRKRCGTAPNSGKKKHLFFAFFFPTHIEFRSSEVFFWVFFSGKGLLVSPMDASKSSEGRRPGGAWTS